MVLYLSIMARSHPQLNIRLPEDLKQRIADSSKAESRSMNAEIVLRLQQSFHNVEPSPAAAREVEKAVEAIVDKFVAANIEWEENSKYAHLLKKSHAEEVEYLRSEIENLKRSIAK